jgi:hypothetical protein
MRYDDLAGIPVTCIADRLAPIPAGRQPCRSNAGQKRNRPGADRLSGAPGHNPHDPRHTPLILLAVSGHIAGRDLRHLVPEKRRPPRIALRIVMSGRCLA